MKSSLDFINIDPRLNPQKFLETLKECQPVIEENLVENGGTLKQANLIEKDYEWSNLIVAIHNQKVIGFSLIRFSNVNQHNITAGGYYYVSQLAVSKIYQRAGIGNMLLEKTLELCNDFPVVASVHENNTESLKLFTRFMTAYEQKKNYIRFVDNEYYISLKEDNVTRV